MRSRLRGSGSQEGCPFREYHSHLAAAPANARDMCTGDCISTPLQAITHYCSNYPDVPTDRWCPIIKVATNTLDSIKSKLIVIKRNSVFADPEDFPWKIIWMVRFRSRLLCSILWSRAERKIDRNTTTKKENESVKIKIMDFYLVFRFSSQEIYIVQ